MIFALSGFKSSRLNLGNVWHTTIRCITLSAKGATNENIWNKMLLILQNDDA